MCANVPNIVLLRPQPLLGGLIRIRMLGIRNNFPRIDQATVLPCGIMWRIDIGASSVIIGKVYERAINKVLSVALVLMLVAVAGTRHLIVLHHDILLYNLSLVSVVSRLACVTSGTRSIGGVVGTFGCC